MYVQKQTNVFLEQEKVLFFSDCVQMNYSTSCSFFFFLSDVFPKHDLFKLARSVEVASSTFPKGIVCCTVAVVFSRLRLEPVCTKEMLLLFRAQL